MDDYASIVNAFEELIKYNGLIFQNISIDAIVSLKNKFLYLSRR